MKNLLHGIYRHGPPGQIKAWSLHQLVAKICAGYRERGGPVFQPYQLHVVSRGCGEGALLSTYSEPVKNIAPTPTLFFDDIFKLQMKYNGITRMYTSRIAPTMPHTAASGAE